MKKESIQITEFKGLNRSTDPTLLESPEFYTFENAELRRSTNTSEGKVGIIAKRNGYGRHNTNQLDSSTPIASIYEHIANGTKYLIGKSDNGSSSVIKHLTNYSGGGWTGISAGETAGRLNFTSFKNNLYIANRNGGAKVNKVWRISDNAYLDHGCLPPWSAVMTATGQNHTLGHVGNGGRHYAVSFLYDNGQESGSVWYKNGVVNGGAGENSIRLTQIPTGNERVVARRLYRLHGASGVYRLLDEIRNNTQDSYDDLKSEDELISVFRDNDELFINLKKPKRAKVQCEHKGRLWQGNIADDFLTPLSSNDITITPQNHLTGDLSGSYTYRIYKSYMAYDIEGFPLGYQIVLSQPVEITPPALVGLNNSYQISFGSNITNDPWFKYVAIYRKDSSSTEYRFVHSNTTSTAGGDAPWHAETNLTYNDIADNPHNFVGKPVFPSTNTTLFPGNVTYSLADKPDLFPSGNEIPLGDNDGQAITSMHSEQNGLVVFKERSIWKIYTGESNPNFWSAEKVVDGIGADEAVSLPNGGYIFYTTKTTPKTGIVFYYWNGSSDPVMITTKIQPLIENATFTVKGLEYDRQTDRVNILVWQGSSMQILLYDLKLDAWFIHKNTTTDLNLYSVCSTQTAGLLFGNGTGRVYAEKDAIPYDSLGSGPSNVDFKLSLRTKTFTIPRGTLKIRRLRCLVDCIGAGVSAAFQFKYSINDASPITLTTQLADGVNQIAHSLGSSEGRKFYLQIDYTEGLRIFIQKIEADINIKHEYRG